MKTTALHEHFGVQVDGIDLRQVTETDAYPEIRELFETHSLLLFRNQQVDDATHRRLCQLFGPLEDRSQGRGDVDHGDMGGVTNVMHDGSLADENDLRMLNLRANMLWHTDSTFLPVPALINMIVAKVVSSSGGATEFASSRAAFESFDSELQERLEQTIFRHRYSHSRRRISAQLAEETLFTMWSDQRWRAVWQNPTNGRKSLYVASHACGADGMADAEAQAFIDELIERTTTQDRVYAHFWQVGDVLVWDERAVLHRGTPWPLDQERSLASYCVSATDHDGLGSVRPGD